MAAPLGNRLQNMLQAAVQSVQWTYSLFWQMCPQQGELVWRDGYYNGAIKTRKTIEPVEVTAKEASLQRSQQLRELYDSLSGGDTDHPARRPCASLSPEDLTESEWFYLICVSFSFPSSSGLPGKAYSKRHHVWLAGANESDSKTFSRAILAKSAGVQTVVCIPMLGGVVEFGTTERVEEDAGFINHVKSFFTAIPPKPALSEHSTSNYYLRHSPPFFAADHPPVHAGAAVDGYEEEAESGSETETGRDRAELVQLESMSEDIRLGSPDDGSIDDLVMDPDLSGADLADRRRRAGLFRAESARRWPMLQQQQQEPLLSSSGVELEAQPQVSGGSRLDELSPEETHYSHTVSAILQNQPSHVAESASTVHSPRTSLQSAFAKWTTPPDTNLHVTPAATSSSQWLLKYVLHTLPLLHSNKDSPESARDITDASAMTRHDELGGGGGSHVLAERRRREKLNERFVILRSLVPFVTKMDKASILGDAIEYLKQLRDKIHDLETRNLHLLQASDQRPISSGSTGVTADKRKVRVVEGPGGGATAVAAAEGITVQVSIIESDALVELECPYREGLLLDVMTTLRELRVEITTVQSSLNDSVFQAEMRAKVRDNGNGKRASIVEVKRAISQIIPQTLES